jgi:hypothetical protein
MRKMIARVVDTLKALVGRGDFPHPYLCFACGGSAACEAMNRRYGYVCPKCGYEHTCQACVHGKNDEDDPPCKYCCGKRSYWTPNAV